MEYFFIYIRDSLVRNLTAGSLCRLEWLSLSGCVHITDAGLTALKQAAAASLAFSDLSGCSRLSGDGLASLAAACPRLPPENLAYCSLIGKHSNCQLFFFFLFFRRMWELRSTLHYKKK